MTMTAVRRQTALGVGLIVACLAGEALVLNTGIDDLDEGYFVQQAARVLHGQIPYRDFATLYTPGLVYLHAGLFALAGGPYLLVPRALGFVTRAALALLLFVLARPLVRQPLWAAVPGLFLLVGLDDAPVLWEPHPGWLSTLFAVMATWCRSHRPTYRWLIASGLCAAIVYAFKQNTGAFMLAAILVWGMIGTAPRRKAVFVPLAAFTGLTALWLIPLVVALRGELAPLGVIVGAVSEVGLFSQPELPLLVPLACLVGGLWLAGREKEPRFEWYVLAGGALFLTEYPRMDTLHLMWSAPLLLVVGAVVLDRLRPPVAVLALCGASVLVSLTLATRLEAITQPLVAITQVPYANGLQVPAATRDDLQGVIAAIQARSGPNGSILVYPTSPLLYALAERSNPTRFDHLNPGAADGRQIAQLITDLQAANVRLVVVSDFWEQAWGPPGANATLEAWIASHFVEVARFGAYRVLTSSI